MIKNYLEITLLILVPFYLYVDEFETSRKIKFLKKEIEYLEKDIAKLIEQYSNLSFGQKIKSQEERLNVAAIKQTIVKLPKTFGQMKGEKVANKTVKKNK